MAHIDSDGAVETYEEPPIRFCMDTYGPHDPVAAMVNRFIHKVRNGGVGSFCTGFIPVPHEARIRVELLEGGCVSVTTRTKDGESGYVIEPT
jgi:hypothetical protein